MWLLYRTISSTRATLWTVHKWQDFLLANTVRDRIFNDAISCRAHKCRQDFLYKTQSKYGQLIVLHMKHSLVPVLLMICLQTTFTILPVCHTNLAPLCVLHINSWRQAFPIKICPPLLIVYMTQTYGTILVLYKKHYTVFYKRIRAPNSANTRSKVNAKPAGCYFSSIFRYLLYTTCFMYRALSLYCGLSKAKYWNFKKHWHHHCKLQNPQAAKLQNIDICVYGHKLQCDSHSFYQTFLLSDRL